MHAASESNTGHQIPIADYDVTYERVNTYVG